MFEILDLLIIVLEYFIYEFSIVLYIITYVCQVLEIFCCFINNENMVILL